MNWRRVLLRGGRHNRIDSSCLMADQLPWMPTAVRQSGVINTGGDGYSSLERSPVESLTNGHQSRLIDADPAFILIRRPGRRLVFFAGEESCCVAVELGISPVLLTLERNWFSFLPPYLR